MNTVKVECQVCGKQYALPTSEWKRYTEEHFSDTDHSEGGYICTECQDWTPGPQEDNDE